MPGDVCNNILAKNMKLKALSYMSCNLSYISTIVERHL